MLIGIYARIIIWSLVANEKLLILPAIATFTDIFPSGW